jgi:hypothetical protein
MSSKKAGMSLFTDISPINDALFGDVELPWHHVNTRRYSVIRYAALARDDARMTCVIAGITGIMQSRTDGHIDLTLLYASIDRRLRLWA